MSAPNRPRWPLLVTLMAGVGALIAVTYLASSSPAGEELPARGGAYVEGVAGAPARINPLFATFNEVDRDLASLLFSGLVRLGRSGEVEPDLAESWRVAPDGRTYSFQLRSGLFWHDGEPLTASDVLFTIRAIQDPEFRGDPVLADLYRDAQVEAPNNTTVIVTLPSPFAPFLARGATVGILPEHLLAGLDAAALFDAPFNTQTVGSGPFRLAELALDRAALQSFDSYHLGRPFLDQLELRFFPDSATLLTAVVEDEVDGAFFRPGLDADEVALLDGEDSRRRTVLYGTAHSVVYLNPAVAAFAQADVRRALQLGLDRGTLIEQALGGQALPIDSPIARDLWAHESFPDAYAFDLEQAQGLLDTAGWPLGPEGRARDGAALSFTLASSDDPVQARVAEEIARQWNELGARVTVETSGASQFVEDVLLPRQFEAALVTIDPGPDPDPYPFWHSSQSLGQGRNLVAFSNPDADRLLEDARQTTSASTRFEDYRAFQEIFARELPAVLVSTPAYQYVVPKDVQGVQPGLLATLGARFRNVHLWYVETEPRPDEST